MESLQLRQQLQSQSRFDFRGLLSDRIAYILQETFLFSGSIMENLKLGNEDATVEEIIDAAGKALDHRAGRS